MYFVILGWISITFMRLLLIYCLPLFCLLRPRRLLWLHLLSITTHLMRGRHFVFLLCLKSLSLGVSGNNAQSWDLTSDRVVIVLIHLFIFTGSFSHYSLFLIYTLFLLSFKLINRYFVHSYWCDLSLLGQVLAHSFQSRNCARSLLVKLITVVARPSNFWF